MQVNIQCWCITIILVWFSTIAYGEDEKPTNGALVLTKRSSQYCGRALVDALSAVCDGKYNSYYKKKSDPSMTRGLYYYLGRERNSDDNSLSPPSEVSSYNSWPYYSKSSIKPLLRFTRGIIDDCCLKACTMDDLESYCA